MYFKCSLNVNLSFSLSLSLSLFGSFLSTTLLATREHGVLKLPYESCWFASAPVVLCCAATTPEPPVVSTCMPASGLGCFGGAFCSLHGLTTFEKVWSALVDPLMLCDPLMLRDVHSSSALESVALL